MNVPLGLPATARDGSSSVLVVVDDDSVLDGYRRQLPGRFRVLVARDGVQALEVLATRPVSVVVSDLRVPVADGSLLLAQVRTLHPDVVRVALTCPADAQAAAAAADQGHVHRSLARPCPPEVLAAALDLAVELHRVLVTEQAARVSAVRRTVDALGAVLSVAQPVASRRAVRLARTAAELAEALQVDAWELEATALLSQLGAVAVPAALLAKVESGLPLTEDEAVAVGQVPAISRDLVSRLPGLDRIALAVGWHPARYDGAGSGVGVPRGADLPLAARVLRLAADFDAGLAQRPSVLATIGALQADPGAYDPQVLAALVRCHDVPEVVVAPQDVDVDDLGPGMVVFDDVWTTEGVLLVSGGTAVTDGLVRCIANYADRGRVGRVVRVLPG